MLFDGFSKLTDPETVMGRFLTRKANAIRDIDPDRIYVENVRALFGFPSRVARLVLDVAAREGVLEKRVGLMCPEDGHIVQSVSSGEDEPERLKCLICESRDLPSEHDPEQSDRIVFYRLP